MSLQPSPSTRRHYAVLLASLILFALAAAALFPFYRYRIVSDDISYLAITQRYLQGDYYHAINAYWSPLNTWLLALLVKVSGWSLLNASYILNCFSFAGVLVLCIKLCGRFVSDRFEMMGSGLCLALFWASNLPVTHFADALNCFLLLCCLVLLLRGDFLRRKELWILYGLLSALAYFSKAYSFYIIPLSTAIVLAYRLKHIGEFTLSRYFIILSSTILCMLVFSFPWLWLIHHKYGIWAISTAGSINKNWAIQGYMYFSKEYPVIVPPAYPGGLSCWEDPWINHGAMLSPFGSAGLLGRQLFRIGVNVLQWFRVINEFSPLYFPVWLLGLLYLLRTKIRSVRSSIATLFIVFLIFPAGYFTLSFGTRYLWFTVPLVMIAGLLFFRRYLLPVLQPRMYRLFLGIYFLSWLPGTVSVMKETLNEGREDHQVAEQLKEMGIKGSFVPNNYPDYQRHFRISWFSGNPVYMHFGDNWSTAELLREARRLQVQYYYYFYNGSNNDYQLLDLQGHPYPEVTNGRIPGLKVFRLQ